MGEILGLGLTHYPPLIGPDANMAGILRTVLKDPGLPERYRDPVSWPEPMRREYGDDGGTTAAAAHRAVIFATPAGCWTSSGRTSSSSGVTTSTRTSPRT
jgi:hypothetical protein